FTVEAEQERQIELWLGGVKAALIVDMVAKYPKQDGAIGLLRAQNLVNYLLRLSPPASKGREPRFIPAIASSKGDGKTEGGDGKTEEGQDEVPRGTVEISLMLLPFSAEVRTALPSISGEKIPTSQATE